MHTSSIAKLRIAILGLALVTVFAVATSIVPATRAEESAVPFEKVADSAPVETPPVVEDIVIAPPPVDDVPPPVIDEPPVVTDDVGTCTPNPSEDLRGPDGTPFNPFAATQIAESGSSASVVVKNFSDTCAYEVNLASYEVYYLASHPDFISSQQLSDSDTITVAPGQTRTLTTSLPACAYQIDLFEGGFVPSSNPNFDGDTYPSLSILDWIVNDTGLPLCGGTPEEDPAYLTVIKYVINDNGGTAKVGDFRLYVGSERVWSEIPTEFAPGTYTVSEQNLPGYTASAWGGDCSQNGTVTLEEGDDKVCTITNNDNGGVEAPVCEMFAQPTTIAPGGTSLLSWTSEHATTAVINQGIGSVSVDGSTNVAPVTTTTYTGTFTGPGGSVTCAATVTVTTQPLATLTVIKNVVNDDGGTAQEDDFVLYVYSDFDDTNGGNSGVSVGRVAPIYVQSREPNTFVPGGYFVGEQNLPGYTAGTWGGDCTADGHVTLATGDNKVCEITNNDIGNGGHTPMCELSAKPLTIELGATSTLSWTSENVTSGSLDQGIGTIVLDGSLDVSPAATTKYTATFSGPYGSVTCDETITVVPVGTKLAKLTVIKNVVNDNGGTAQESDFKLFVENLMGAGVSRTQVVSRETNTFPAGTYRVSEDNISGYTAGTWGGDCAANGDVTLNDGDNKTCTITNDDEGGQCTENCGGGGGGGGGGSSRPKVSLFTDPQVLGVSLSQVPYTGLGTSIFQIVLFVLGLLAISGGIVYLIIRRKNNGAELSVPVREQHSDAALEAAAEDALSAYEEYTGTTVPARTEARTDGPSYARPIGEALPAAPANLPGVIVSASEAPRSTGVTTTDAARQPAVSIAKLQTEARADRALVSDDGIKLIVASAEDNEEKARERLNQVLAIAKTRYPREDGWLILDKGRVREALFISVLGTVPLFIEWVVRGEDKKIFAFLRMLKAQEQPVADFVRKVVAELDNVHRARLEGTEDVTRTDVHVAEVTYHLSQEELERMISELLNGVDERYDSAYTSVRLAVMRVLDMLKERVLKRVGGTYAFSENSFADAQ